MKDKLKNAARRLNEFEKKNRKVIAVSLVAIAAIWLQQSNLKDFYKFLESKGIDPMEFYCPEAYEELKK